MRFGTMLLALALAVGPACKKKEENAATSGETGSGSAMTGSSAGSGATGSAGSGSAAAGSGSDTGSAAAGSGSDTGAAAGSAAGSAADAQAMAHHAGNCPSTVFGSMTKDEVKAKAVVVTITSDDKDAIAAIQKRTEEMLKARMEKHAADGHDKRGSHGGSIGMCPLHIPEGATAKAKNEKNGVSVTITPKDKVDDLKAIIDARIAKSTEWVKANIKPGDEGTTGGVGGGKGDDGSNHSGQGDGKGKDRKKGDGSGGGTGTGGGGGKGTGGGGSKKG